MGVKHCQELIALDCYSLNLATAYYCLLTKIPAVNFKPGMFPRMNEYHSGLF